MLSIYQLQKTLTHKVHPNEISVQVYYMHIDVQESQHDYGLNGQPLYFHIISKMYSTMSVDQALLSSGHADRSRVIYLINIFNHA